MIFGAISVMKNWRYGMNDHNDESNLEDVSLGVEVNHHYDTIERDYVQMSLGGIYKRNIDNQEYQLTEYLEDINQAVFKNLTTLKNKVLSVHEFSNITNQSDVSVKVDLNDIADEDWQKAQKKLLAIKPLIGGAYDEYIGERGYERRANETGVSARTLKRWVKAYKSTNSIASLLDKKRGWQGGKGRISKQLETLIDEVINEFYLSIQRPSVEATIREVFKRCHQRAIVKPSKNTVRRRIERISERDFLRGRGYRERAKDKFTPKAGVFPNADYPLSVIQIDHTPVDIILVDDKYRKPIGRPFITVAIDVYSRMITGYYIALDAPSVTSVGMCISRSVLPKTDLLLDFGLSDAKWDVFGIPRKIHVDNGSDFRAESLKKSCAFHGIDLEFRPLARPEFGGHIERLIGTLMKKVHELPGTTFSNIKQKDNYNSEKNASLTLHEFETWFLTYVVKVYHQTIHNGINKTPTQQWQIGLFGDDFNEGIGIPALPSNPKTILLDFMPSVERTIQRNGVNIGGLSYYDPSLNNFINQTDSSTKKKKQFTFRQDPRDISIIWFYDPILKTYFDIPLANQALPAMSLWEYKQLYKQVKQQSGTVNESLIYQAWEDMQALVETSEQTTKTLRRQEQRRKTHIKSQQIHQPLKDDISAMQAIAKPESVQPIVEDDDGLDFFEDIR